MMCRLSLSVLAAVLLTVTAEAQGKPDLSLPPSHTRVEVSGGLGVGYIGATDVVNLANSTPGAMERIPEFKSAVEFFGLVDVPLSESWVLKLEYAYMLASYSVSTTAGTGIAEHTLTAHLPSAVIQYVLVGEPMYNLKVGVGGGYHFGSLSRKFFLEDDVYAGKGPGALVDLEGNTALSEHLFAMLGVNLRWEWIGNLTNAAGRTPYGNAGATTMHLFGPGARIGVAYLL